MVLAIRTDKPEAELYLLEDGQIAFETKWPAHRELADTLLRKIEELLSGAKISLADISGVIIFTGDGSFTGLRIGTTVANAIAYSNNIPIVTAVGEGWIEAGLKNISNTKPGELVVPSYHSEPNITSPKKLSLEERPK